MIPLKFHYQYQRFLVSAFDSLSSVVHLLSILGNILMNEMPLKYFEIFFHLFFMQREKMNLKFQ